MNQLCKGSQVIWNKNKKVFNELAIQTDWSPDNEEITLLAKEFLKANNISFDQNMVLTINCGNEDHINFINFSNY